MAWKNIPDKSVLATFKDAKNLKGQAAEKMTIYTEGGVPGPGGTSDFNDLEHRPKYNGREMNGDTNIPEVPKKTLYLYTSEFAYMADSRNMWYSKHLFYDEAMTAGNYITWEDMKTELEGGTRVIIVDTLQEVMGNTTDLISYEIISFGIQSFEFEGETVEVPEFSLIRVRPYNNYQLIYTIYATPKTTFTPVRDKWSFTKIWVQPELSAGDNIRISGRTISATDTTYTAGSGINISAENVISASGGGGVTILTTDDYNWNIDTQSAEDPNCIGNWLLEDGLYKVEGGNVSIGGHPGGWTIWVENGYLLVSMATFENGGDYGEWKKKTTYVMMDNVIYVVVNEYNRWQENEWTDGASSSFPTYETVDYLVNSKVIHTTDGIPTPSTYGQPGQIYIYIDEYANQVRMFVCSGDEWDEQTYTTTYFWDEINEQNLSYYTNEELEDIWEES